MRFPPQSRAGQILFSFAIALVIGLGLSLLLGESFRSGIVTGIGLGIGNAFAEWLFGFQKRQSEPENP